MLIYTHSISPFSWEQHIAFRIDFPDLHIDHNDMILS